MSAATVEQVLVRVHREKWARVVAALARRFGQLDLAEEMAAEAFATAVERWPRDGVPPNPGGWITTTASRKAIDRLRREAQRESRHEDALLLRDDSPAEQDGVVSDDRLRLLFVCCHPALAMEARVALTLRMVGGLTVPEIAHAFLVQETTMGQRISRAKAKIKAARIPFRVPGPGDLADRVTGVLAVLYLVFNEGYLASGENSDPIRGELTGEAIRLARLVSTLLPHHGEATGLLALMLLTEARAAARVSADGELVRLHEQNRGAWDQALIVEGLALVRGRLDAVERGEAVPGRFQILAAINAVHTFVADARDTDWSQVVALYDMLAALDPSPIVAMNRAIALAEVDGCEAGLGELERLAGALDGYHAFHAARADLLERLGRRADAAAAYARAIELAGNAAEVAHLTRRRGRLVG